MKSLIIIKLFVKNELNFSKRKLLSNKSIEKVGIICNSVWNMCHKAVKIKINCIVDFSSQKRLADHENTSLLVTFCQISDKKSLLYNYLVQHSGIL